MIADDKDELTTIPIKERTDGCKLKEIKAPSLLLKAPCLVVLSHLKGHELTGFGGAVKNLGMGGVSTETKRAQHHMNMPIYAEERECNACGKCADNCPTDAITMVDEKPKRAEAECIYCGTCFFCCPHTAGFGRRGQRKSFRSIWVMWPALCLRSIKEKSLS
jgi:hypothetical protein